MKSLMFCRISDNVLDEECWPVRLLVLSEDGNIVHSEDLPEPAGCYDRTGMPEKGWTADRLVEWLSYDSTGKNPENYFEIKAGLEETYRSVYSREDLNEAIRDGLGKYTDVLINVNEHPGAPGTFHVIETGYRGDVDYDNLDSTEIRGERDAVDYAVTAAEGWKDRAARVGAWDNSGEEIWPSRTEST